MRLARYVIVTIIIAALAALLYGAATPGGMRGLLDRAISAAAPAPRGATSGARHLAALPPRPASPVTGVHPQETTAPREAGAPERRATRPDVTVLPAVGQPSSHHSIASSKAVPPRAIGTSIVIPRLGIHAPVYDLGDDGQGHLPIARGYAVTHYTFSGALGQPGNYVIYGHDDIYGSIFNSLPSMQAGDLVYLHHGTRRYTYRVTGSMIVAPDDVAVLDPTPSATLTMISCTPMYVDTQRIVVRARLIAVDG